MRQTQALLACAAYRQEESGLGQREAAIGELADWLLGHQQPSGAWAWRPSRDVAWTASTAYGMLALAAAASTTGVRSDDITNALAEAKAWLWHSRNADERLGITGWRSLHIRPSPAWSPTAWPNRGGGSSRLGVRAVPAPNSGEAGRLARRDRSPYRALHPAFRRRLPASWALRRRTLWLLRSEGVRRGYRALIRVSFRGSYFEFRNTSMCVWPTRDSVLALSAVTQSILNGSAPRPQRNDPRVAE